MARFTATQCQNHVRGLSNDQWTGHSGYPSKFTGVDDNMSMAVRSGGVQSQRDVGKMEMLWDCATNGANPSNALGDKQLVPYDAARRAAEDPHYRSEVEQQIYSAARAGQLGAYMEGEFQGIFSRAVDAARSGQRW